MTADAEFRPDGNRLIVSGHLDFDNVAELAAQGRDWLHRLDQPDCHLELSGVTANNSAGVALLLAWLRAAQAANKRLHLHQVPARLTAMIELAGLGSQLR